MGDLSWGMGVWDLGDGECQNSSAPKISQTFKKNPQKSPKKFIKTVITTSQWRFLPSHLVCQRIRACATY